jgi:hypothetical protein
MARSQDTPLRHAARQREAVEHFVDMPVARPDAYLRNMSEYFASEQPPFSLLATPTVSNAILARGEMLA